jgi:hypothetical protein
MLEAVHFEVERAQHRPRLTADHEPNPNACAA